MSELLHRTDTAWRQLHGLATATEIQHQPAMWRAMARGLEAQRQRIEAFLGSWLEQPAHRVILTGAGSSAYIGELVADGLEAARPADIRAVPSTTLLTHPQQYLDPARPTLLVSLARSGNSPESLEAVQLVRRTVTAARFLNITCNGAGSLARAGEARPDTLSLLMPEDSCDRGFAMTSSFSTMLLAALLVLDRAPWSVRLQRVAPLAERAEAALRAWAPGIAALAAQPLARIVFLGSGPLEALAREAALKVLELTGGRVLAMANTSLGFRHGPKAVLNRDSLVVVFRSSARIAQRYEQDLIDELRREQIAGRVRTVGADTGGPGAPDFSVPPLAQPDAWLAALWLLMPQQLALHRSVELGLTPDDPFPDGTLNRVVTGVTLHSEAAR